MKHGLRNTMEGAICARAWKQFGGNDRILQAGCDFHVDASVFFFGSVDLPQSPAKVGAA
jgi:hypothetical protein